MDEKKSKRTKSRQNSVDSNSSKKEKAEKVHDESGDEEKVKPKVASKRVSRVNSTDSNKSKKSGKDHNTSDGGSSTSENAVRSCSVVLEKMGSIALRTRTRTNSTLTVDNLAALSSPSKVAPRRSVRAASVASDETASTVTRTRSTRLSSSQNTPKKETTTSRSTAVATPTRRSSRLVENSETVVGSPLSAVLPAKRRLRSNSTQSDDVPASPARRATRRLLSETQSTPNDPEVVKTPTKKLNRRQSKRIVDEVIEEQPDEDVVIEKEKEKDTEQGKTDDESHAEKATKLKTPKAKPLEISSDVEKTNSTVNESAVTQNKAVGHPDVEMEEMEIESSTLEPSNDQQEKVSTKTAQTSFSETLIKVKTTPTIQKPVAEMKTAASLDEEKGARKSIQNISQDVHIDLTSDDDDDDVLNEWKSVEPKKSKSPNSEKQSNVADSMNDTALVGQSIVRTMTPKIKAQQIVATPKTKTPLKEKSFVDGDKSIVDLNESAKNSNSETVEPMEPEVVNMNVTELMSQTIAGSPVVKGEVKSPKTLQAEALLKDTDTIADKEVLSTVDGENVVRKTPEPVTQSPLATSQKIGNNKLKESSPRTPRVKTPAKGTSEGNSNATKVATPKTKTPLKEKSFVDVDKPVENVNKSVGTTKLEPVEPIELEIASMNVTGLINQTISESPAIKGKAKSPKASQVKAQPKNTSMVAEIEITDSVEVVNAATNTPETSQVTPIAASPLNATQKVEKNKSDSPKESQRKTPLKDTNVSNEVDGAASVDIPETEQSVKKVRTPKKVIRTSESESAMASESGTPSANASLFVDMDVTTLVTEANNVQNESMRKQSENESTSVDSSKEVSSSGKKSQKSPKAKSPKSAHGTPVVKPPKDLQTEMNKLFASFQTPVAERTESAAPFQETVIVQGEVEPMEVDESIVYEENTNNLSTAENDISTLSTKSRKSVQILTPKTESKNTSAFQRIATPYPDNSIIEEVIAMRSQLETSSNASRNERLKGLSNSWNLSVKRNSVENCESTRIDNLGANVEKTDDTPKKSVAARNNWSASAGLIDTDSDSESEKDIIAKTEEQVDEEVEDEHDESDEENEEPDFLDDKADAVEDYESGDSMDEGEREYLAENEIQEGIEIGSDDTDGESDHEGESDNESLDSFIVPDSDVIETQSNDSDTEIPNQNRATRRSGSSRYSRLVVQESTSDEENEEAIVVISMENVEQAVVVEPTQVEAKIMEGKTFETTILLNKDEEEQPKPTVNKEKESATEGEAPIILVKVEATTEIEESEETKETEQVPEIIEQKKSSEETAEVTPASKSTADKTEDAEEIDRKTEQVVKIPILKKASELEDSHVSNESDASSTSSSKENKIVRTNTQRHSLSIVGIEAMSKTPLEVAKNLARHSLGNLKPSQQTLQVSPARIQYTKTVTPKQEKVSKKSTPKKIETEKNEEKANNKNDSVASEESEADTSSKSNDAKIASSQEENNNKKISREEKAVETAISSATGVVKKDTSQSFNETSNDELDDEIDEEPKKAKKQKRQFIEMDQAGPSRPKKMFNFINTKSGTFVEEPMTPEKPNKFGFKESPMTPINRAFKIEQIKTAQPEAQVHGRTFKRRRIEIAEPAMTLPKPKWSTDDKNGAQVAKRKRLSDVDGTEVGATEVVVKPLKMKRKKQASELIPKELYQFRQNQTGRVGGVQRKDARTLLAEKRKRAANFK